MKDHRLIDRRSRALGRAVARRVAADPSLAARARATLDRWRATASPRSRPALDEWADALDGPPVGVVALLTGRDERATRLRQSSPFAGALPPAERNAILRRYQAVEARVEARRARATGDRHSREGPA